MTVHVVVIGMGNGYRRDDGVGPAVAAAIDQRALPGVRVLTDVADPIALLDAWSGAALAVVIDAAIANPLAPGRLRRCTIGEIAESTTLSSHGIDVAYAVGLGTMLLRMPGELVLFTVEAADTGHGVGLTPQVAAAVPKAANAIVADIAARRCDPPTGHLQDNPAAAQHAHADGADPPASAAASLALAPDHPLTSHLASLRAPSQL